MDEQIVEMIRQDFPIEHQTTAIGWLTNECGRNLPLCENADDAQLRRIQAAVVNLSTGDLEKLRYWIDAAKKDWRDVLIGN
jgi:hypothetical protein